MSVEAKKIMADMFGVFGQKAEDVKISSSEQSGSSVFFNPSPKDCKDQVWRGIIKFLPHLNGDLSTMTVKKVQYRVPEGEKGSFVYDSPKSINKYENCIVADAYWSMFGSEDPRLKKLSKRIRYSNPTFALVQIIVDQHKPENNGKIMVWDLPKAIEKKINEAMYPSKEDVEIGKEANNVFDPINGLPMILKIGIKSADGSEYRDYDSCDFTTNAKISKLPIIAGEDKQREAVPAEAEALQAYQNAIIETILAGPNLADYGYKAPTEEILTRVTKALNALQGATVVEDEAKPETAQPVTAQPVAETAQPVTAQTAATEATQPATAQPVTAQPATTTPVTSADDDLLNDILGNNSEQ